MAPRTSRKAQLLLVVIAPAAAALILALLVYRFGPSWFEHPAFAFERVPQRTAGAVTLTIALAAFGVVWWALTLFLTHSAGNARIGGADINGARVQESRSWNLVVAALVAIAAVVRLPRLLESLWYDEIASLTQFVSHGPGAIIGNYFDPVNHILYSLLAWLSITVFGEPIEISARLPAFLASLALIPLAAFLVRDATGRLSASLFAGALSAIMPVFVLEAANARAYALVMALSTAASWMMLRALREDRSGWYIAYALIAALNVWAHFVAAFLSIGHAVYALFLLRRRESRGRAARALASIALAGACALTLYAPVLPDLMRLVRGGMFETASADQPGLFGVEGLHALLQLGGSWSPWASATGLALLAIGAWVAFAGHRRSSSEEAGARPPDDVRRAAVLALLGLPLFALFVAAIGSWMYARFTLFAMPGAVLLMAVALDRLGRMSRPTAIAAVCLVIAGSAADLFTRPARQPLRDAVAYALANTPEREPVMAVGLRHGVILVLWPQERPVHFTIHDDDGRFETLITEERPAMILVYYPHLLEPRGRNAFLAQHGYAEEARFPGWLDWGRGDVVIFAPSDIHH